MPNPPPPPPGANAGASGTAAASQTVSSLLGTANETAGPYPDTSVLLAVVLTVFAPFISLIVALALMADQRSPARREQLKSWAIVSGVWLAIGGIIFIAAVASITGGGAPSSG